MSIEVGKLKFGTSVPTAEEVEEKATKVAGATEGNIAGLDASGNLSDSGVSKTFVQSRMTGYLEDTENPNTKILVLTSGAVPNA